ncbi:MAG: hypothetical protein ACRYGP_16895 [Janthinobacterium lividum]
MAGHDLEAAKRVGKEGKGWAAEAATSVASTSAPPSKPQPQAISKLQRPSSATSDAPWRRTLLLSPAPPASALLTSTLGKLRCTSASESHTLLDEDVLPGMRHMMRDFDRKP